MWNGTSYNKIIKRYKAQSHGLCNSSCLPFRFQVSCKKKKIACKLGKHGTVMGCIISLWLHPGSAAWNRLRSYRDSNRRQASPEGRKLRKSHLHANALWCNANNNPARVSHAQSRLIICFIRRAKIASRSQTCDANLLTSSGATSGISVAFKVWEQQGHWTEESCFVTKSTI